MSFDSFVQSIPDLLLYVVPGYFGITLLFGILNYRAEESMKVMLSLAGSYLSLAIIRLIYSGENIYVEFLLALVFCCVLAVFFAKIAQNKSLRNYMARNVHFSFAKGPWEDAYNYKVGSRIQFKCKSSGHFIVGVVHNFGDPDKYPWLSLSRYTIYDKKDGCEISSGGANEFLLIDINEIEYAQMWPDTDKPKSSKKKHRR